MQGKALNADGRTVAAPDVTSMNELLNLSYAWNSDETREHMIVSRVEFAGVAQVVAVQHTLFGIS